MKHIMPSMHLENNIFNTLDAVGAIFVYEIFKSNVMTNEYSDIDTRSIGLSQVPAN